MNPFEDYDLIRAGVSEDIWAEREAQIDKWGVQTHPICEWMTILGEEVGEACQEALRIRFGPEENRKQYTADLRKELIQCAAVCVAIVEQIEEDTDGTV